MPWFRCFLVEVVLSSPEEKEIPVHAWSPCNLCPKLDTVSAIMPLGLSLPVEYSHQHQHTSLAKDKDQLVTPYLPPATETFLETLSSSEGCNFIISTCSPLGSSQFSQVFVHSFSRLLLVTLTPIGKSSLFLCVRSSPSQWI